MANPPGGFGRAEMTDPAEPAADHPAGHPRADRFPRPAERAGESLFHVREIAADQERLIDLEQQQVDGILAGLKERTPAELPGVDLSAIKRADPEFDDEGFRAIARETFYKVREARTRQDPQPVDGRSPWLDSHQHREIASRLKGLNGVGGRPDRPAHDGRFATLTWSEEATFTGKSAVLTYWHRPLHAMTDACTGAWQEGSGRSA